MEKDNKNSTKVQPVFSLKVRAGKKRTYFFDVKPTRANDYYLTITESKKLQNEEGYERHKIFLYKEDFNKFMDVLGKTIGHVKTELMPDYDFDEFDRRNEEWERNRAAQEQQGGSTFGNESPKFSNDVQEQPVSNPGNTASQVPPPSDDEEAMKW